MNAFCSKTGVGLIPWAPLCRAHLARPPKAFGASKQSALKKGAGSKAMVSASKLPGLDKD
jgi:aryl-alcohol dehydrogenase-like predicted oxidoreductase